MSSAAQRLALNKSRQGSSAVRMRWIFRMQCSTASEHCMRKIHLIRTALLPCLLFRRAEACAEQEQAGKQCGSNEGDFSHAVWDSIRQGDWRTHVYSTGLDSLPALPPRRGLR